MSEIIGQWENTKGGAFSDIKNKLSRHETGRENNVHVKMEHHTITRGYIGKHGDIKVQWCQFGCSKQNPAFRIPIAPLQRVLAPPPAVRLINSPQISP